MKLSLSIAALALSCTAPASAAVIISDYNITFTSGSTVISSGAKTAPGEYQDNFHFHTDTTTTFSGSLSTQRLRDLSGMIVSDLDFGNSLPGDGVHVDATWFTVASGGTDALEVENLPTTTLEAGDHLLTINYTVQAADAANAAVYAGPLFLAITPVPEPSSWALMLVGIGTIGVAMRRRKVTQLSFG